MNSTMLDFYLSLPSVQDCPFYVEGYSEALEFISGVRVIPNKGFIEGLSEDIRKNILSVGFPCYYIPNKVGKDHYGFIVKGNKKGTPRYGIRYKFFNLEAVFDGQDILYIVEGIKDAFLFLFFKRSVVASLTTQLSDSDIEEISRHKKVVVIVSDNDTAGVAGSSKMFKKFRALGVSAYVYRPKLHKDLGDWFDRPELRGMIKMEFKSIIKVGESLVRRDEHYAEYLGGM